MNAKKIIISVAFLFGATSAALAQSAWTTGTAADRARAGYASPYGGGLYGGYASYAEVRPAHHPRYRVFRRRGLHAFARIPADPPGSGSLNPAATGGGSPGYNWALLHDE